MAEATVNDYYEREEISIDGDSESDGYVSEDSYYEYDAEAEWEESKAQINALFSLVVFPFIGKWLGKKASFWLWTRYMSPLDSSPASIFSTEWLNGLKRIAQ